MAHQTGVKRRGGFGNNQQSNTAVAITVGAVLTETTVRSKASVLVRNDKFVGAKSLTRKIDEQERN